MLEGKTKQVFAATFTALALYMRWVAMDLNRGFVIWLHFLSTIPVIVSCRAA